MILVCKLRMIRFIFIKKSFYVIIMCVIFCIFFSNIQYLIKEGTNFIYVLYII